MATPCPRAAQWQQSLCTATLGTRALPSRALSWLRDCQPLERVGEHEKDLIFPCSGSPPKFENGSTASEGASDRASVGDVCGTVLASRALVATAGPT